MVVSRKDNEPHPIDVYVGGRMRLRRIQLGLSQGALASKIGVSFQAVQKYESGDIRISASRLYDVSQVLDVSPAFFFEGYPDGMVAKNLAEEIALRHPRPASAGRYPAPDLEAREPFDRAGAINYPGAASPAAPPDPLRSTARQGW